MFLEYIVSNPRHASVLLFIILMHCYDVQWHVKHFMTCVRVSGHCGVCVCVCTESAVLGLDIKHDYSLTAFSYYSDAAEKSSEYQWSQSPTTWRQPQCVPRAITCSHRNIHLFEGTERTLSSESVTSEACPPVHENSMRWILMRWGTAHQLQVYFPLTR